MTRPPAAERLIVADSIAGSQAARAVVVRDGVIVDVLDEAGLRRRSTGSAETVEVAGTILPGLTDAHSHPVLGATNGRGADLTGVRNRAQLLDALAAERTRAGVGDWIFGWGLEHSVFEGRDPSAADIAPATADTPCTIRMFDAHSMLINDAALVAAGITRGHRFETGSEILEDSTGEPTGYLLEFEAMAVAERAMPAEPDGAVLARLEDVLQRMSAAGLTGAHVMDANGDSAALYAELEAAGRLPLRLRLHSWIVPGMSTEEWNQVEQAIGSGGALWSFHGVKLFIDGTVDNGTAWLRTPDRDGASARSAWDEPSRYREAIRFFVSHGVPTATHAIGDQAVRYAAAAIADVVGLSAARHRIEHLEVTGDDIIADVRASGAVASMHPTHCTHFVAADGSDNWSQRIGPRAAQGWRISSLLEAGVPLALGSDWPIAHFAPLPIIAAAHLRRPAGSEVEPVIPAEGISVADAIAGYTSGPAYAAGVDATEGRIAPGFRADFTVLEDSPMSVSPEALAELRVNATFLGGDPVFSG